MRIRELPPPTHTCFDDALDYLAALRDRGYSLAELERQLWIMHGICLDPYNDQPIAHAWVQGARSGATMQAGLLPSGVRRYYRLEDAEFTIIMRPQLVTRYKVSQALAENDRHNTFGPWLPQYLELCRGARCRHCGELWPSAADAARAAEAHRAGRCARGE